jgi:hypothetical protein
MPIDLKQSQISLFDAPDASGHLRLESLDWPPPERFPLNAAGRQVREQVIGDLESSENPLIVAGYSSIDYLVDFASRLSTRDGRLRLLVGTEPFPGNRPSYASAASFPKEVESYWLGQGVSLRLSAKIVQTMDLIRAGRLEARYLGDQHAKLHAKIYATESAITIGSSNFTQTGLTRQIEANVRLTPKDKGRFTEAQTIAENLWKSGDPYSDELVSLLESLLRVVGWQEALARASAELLEGEWARDYLKAQMFVGDLPLWPSQEQGIAEAMWVLQNVGSVLVADATGSGKTRLGAHLMRAVVDRIWRHGRVRKAPAVVVAPPAVNQNWVRAAREAGVPLDVQSHGKLSHASSQTHDNVTDAVRRAQVLAVDEAHNFLNPSSRRTRAILGNMADHAILFTATPINRSAVDLLRLADMLGADNLADSTLEAFSALLRRPKLDRTLSGGELAVLKHELQRFTVRRTKKMLNSMVDLAPEAYRDATGHQCRYPEHRAKIYPLHESDNDRDLATQIRAASTKLHGVALIDGDIAMPDVLQRENWTEEKYIESRLRTASRLSSYLVMATLRSSSAAMFEHITGTRAALTRFGLADDAKRQATGNVLGKLHDISGRPPRSQLTAPLPEWLTDPDAHRAACAEDVSTYEHILALAGQMSDRREIAKAGLLRKLVRRHEMIVAFDSRPITLSLLKKHLATLDADTEVILATGERKASRRAVEDRLRLGAEKKRLIALCSDSMSEGVNLQGAAAVVHLDLPSVVRIAEQRVGRVDRMDSPHKAIEAWWPQDAPELALRSDEKFIERYETVDALLGSNLPLPEGLGNSPLNNHELVTASQAIKEFEEEQDREPWDGLRDVFAPVRDLISGPDALVPKPVYEHYRHVSTRVLSRVSLVKADEPWGLVCFTGSSIGAPRWVFVRDNASTPLVDLTEISTVLRQRLGPGTADLALSDKGMRWLNRVLTIVQDQEIALLPRRKRRALEEMRIVLRSYGGDSYCSLDMEQGLANLLKVLDREDDRDWYDWDAIAETWLDLIRPVWYERLTTRKRLRPLLLKDIRRDLQGPRRIPLAQILMHFQNLPTLPPIDERVAACILGVSSAQ